MIHVHQLGGCAPAPLAHVGRSGRAAQLPGALRELGRRSSDGRRVPAPETNCCPEQAGNTPGRGWEQIALLAPDSASAFETWRAARLEEALADLAVPEGRRPAKALLGKRAKAEEPYPADLMDCLQKDTTWLRSHGWNRPPGSRRVFYWRPGDAVSVGVPKARRAIRSPRVDAMLLSLTNASRNDHALPPVTRTLPQAELLHRALVGIAARNGLPPPPELAGRDGDRRPLRGPHEHAHINPLDLDGDGHLDHVLVWAPGGLGANAQAAIRAARKTFTKGGIEPLRLALAATGDLSDMGRLPGIHGRRMDRLTSRAIELAVGNPLCSSEAHQGERQEHAGGTDTRRAARAGIPRSRHGASARACATDPTRRAGGWIPSGRGQGDMESVPPFQAGASTRAGTPANLRIRHSVGVRAPGCGPHRDRLRVALRLGVVRLRLSVGSRAERPVEYSREDRFRTKRIVHAHGQPGCQPGGRRSATPGPRARAFRAVKHRGTWRATAAGSGSGVPRQAVGSGFERSPASRPRQRPVGGRRFRVRKSNPSPGAGAASCNMAPKARK